MKSLCSKRLSALAFGALLGCLGFLSTASATHTPNIDTDAPVVKLLKSCTESGATLKNCFDTVTSLNSWINATRKPDSTKPLLVEIGPGKFTDAGLICDTVSNITYRGSGQEQTKISQPIGFAGFDSIRGCTNIAVKSLTLEGYWGVQWKGTGSSSWTNVTARGIIYGWFDYACPGFAGGNHYWFSSRIIADGIDLPSNFAKGYGINCGQSWFFGSEILAIGNNPTMGLYVNNGEAHVYGSVIRAIAKPGATFPVPSISTHPQEEGDGLYAALSANNAKLHIHGTGIDVISTNSHEIAALMASTGGEIHANGAAYSLETGGNKKIHRLINNTTIPGHIHAPYMWEPHTTPPVNAGSTTNYPGNTLVSLDGADMAVETDCTSTGCPTTNPGIETHLLIYNSKCTGPGGTWFDVVTKACRTIN